MLKYFCSFCFCPHFYYPDSILVFRSICTIQFWPQNGRQRIKALLYLQLLLTREKAQRQDKAFFSFHCLCLLIFLLTKLNTLTSPANYRSVFLEHTNQEIKLRKVISKKKLKSNVQKFSILQAWP